MDSLKFESLKLVYKRFQFKSRRIEGNRWEMILALSSTVSYGENEASYTEENNT